MKLLRYFTALLITLAYASTVAADTLSEQELQERFNRAFSIFHGRDDSSLRDLIQEGPTAEQAEQGQVSLSETDDNIIRSTPSVIEEETPVINKPKNIQLPTSKLFVDPVSPKVVDLGERTIFIDMQNSTLDKIVDESLRQAAINEDWSIRWRLKDENKYLLKERINLTAELDFDSFIGNMIETITNITGIKLSTKVFHNRRIIIITDSF